jgi:methylmalonyl-CoA mutase
VIRATERKKTIPNHMLKNLHKANHDKVNEMLNTIQEAAINNENLFEILKATKVCSLGITSALFEVGGQYRRNIEEPLCKKSV